ncbi:unnamed protein product [Scytosiphon promiscuus]
MEGIPDATSANNLLEALTNGGSHKGGGSGGGGGEAGASTFGLGVGFALSPELAQKVREGRGVSSAPAVPTSSLTFLKAATLKGTAVANSSANAAIDSSEQQPQGEKEQEQQSRRHPGGSEQEHRSQHQHQEGDAVRSASTRGAAQDGNSPGLSLPAGEANGTIDRSVENGISGGGSSRGIRSSKNSSSNNSGGGGGDGGGGDGSPEVARHERVGGHADQEGISSTHAGHEDDNMQDRGKGEKEADGADAAAAAAADVAADPPDSWEEFDESTLPPASGGTSAPGADGAGAATTGANGSGGDGAPAARLGSNPGDVGSSVSGDDMAVQHRQHPGEEPVEEVRPESVPVLLVDLARVCGFRVKGAREAEAVGRKIRAALHESFAERSEELFETGSAVHSDTSSLAEELHRRTEASSITSSWAVVEYPATLNANSTAGASGGPGVGTGAVGVTTSEAWAAVTTPSSCRAVEAVRIALVGTNRHLVWKRDMLEQLEAVAASERKAREERDSAERQAELDTWRERRREQLEKLIEIRPMFERRRAMAEEKLIAAGSGGGDGAAAGRDGDGEAAADPVSAAVIQSLDAKLETIDDLIARLEIEEGEEGYGFVPSDEEGGDVDDDTYDYLDDVDGDDDVGGGDAGGGRREGESKEGGLADKAASMMSATTAATAPPSAAGAAADAEARKKARKNNKKKKKKSGLGIVQQLKAKAEGNCTSNVGASVKEGEADEGGIVTATGGRDGSRSEPPPPDMGLLDAVAAMILGRYPQDPRATNEQHFQKIAAMHQHMKDAWSSEFGRLPPMTT